MSYQEYKVRVYSNRTVWYNIEGYLHRDDGPAIEHSDGSKSWYQNNQRHRDDGPAVEYANGSKEWYQNGQCHRDDGPAIEWADGHKAWYLEGEYLTEAEFNALQQTCEGKVVEIEGKKYKLVKV